MPKGTADKESRHFLSSNTIYARTLLGMTQEQLAELAELDRTQISAIERMVSGASVDSVARLARAIGVHTYVMLMPPSQAHPLIIAVVEPKMQKKVVDGDVERKKLRHGSKRGVL